MCFEIRCGQVGALFGFVPLSPDRSEIIFDLRAMFSANTHPGIIAKKKCNYDPTVT
jgi:hypothetical protein